MSSASLAAFREVFNFVFFIVSVIILMNLLIAMYATTTQPQTYLRNLLLTPAMLMPGCPTRSTPSTSRQTRIIASSLPRWSASISMRTFCRRRSTFSSSASTAACGGRWRPRAGTQRWARLRSHFRTRGASTTCGLSHLFGTTCLLRCRASRRRRRTTAR